MPISLFLITEEVEEMFMLQCKGKGLKFSIELDPYLQKFKAEVDQQRFVQILVNLISNSLKFTTEGHISASLRLGKDMKSITVRVIDSGIGIKKEDQNHLFEKFSLV
jgi:signal transduction histidine kinase